MSYYMIPSTIAVETGIYTKLSLGLYMIVLVYVFYMYVRMNNYVLIIICDDSHGIQTNSLHIIIIL